MITCRIDSLGIWSLRICSSLLLPSYSSVYFLNCSGCTMWEVGTHMQRWRTFITRGVLEYTNKDLREGVNSCGGQIFVFDCITSKAVLNIATRYSDSSLAWRFTLCQWAWRSWISHTVENQLVYASLWKIIATLVGRSVYKAMALGTLVSLKKAFCAK